MRLVAFLPVVMLFANAIGLLTQVLIPRFLVPAEYNIFSTTWAYGQFTSVFFFEWLRLSLLRFSEGVDADAVQVRRRAMASSLFALIGSLLAISAVGLLLNLVVGVPAWIAAVTFYACCQGAFDSLQARRRAASQHKRFIGTWSSRSLLSLALALTVAAVTRSGLCTVLALAISYPISLLADLRRAPGHLREVRYDREVLSFLFGFGAFMAAANALGLLFPALVRFQANLYLPASAAGGIALAFDYLQKVVSLAGLAINIIVSQRSFRSAEFDQAHQQLAQVKLQIFAPASLILCAAAGFVVLLHGFSHVLVPPAYAVSFHAVLAYAALSTGLIAVRMYSLDPLFVMSTRTRFAIVGPAVTLIAAAGLAALLVWRGADQIDAIGIAATAGAATGLVVSFLVLQRSVAMPPVAGSTALLIGCIGTGLALAFALPEMPIWADLPIRLAFVGAASAIVPTIIFRSELTSVLARVRTAWR